MHVNTILKGRPILEFVIIKKEKMDIHLEMSIHFSKVFLFEKKACKYLICILCFPILKFMVNINLVCGTWGRIAYLFIEKELPLEVAESFSF